MMNIAETCMYTHKNTIKSTCIVLHKYTCCRCLVSKKRGRHLESSSRLRYCDLRRVVFQYDHYPGAIVNSSIGYSSWSEREEKGSQGYRCTQYKPTKVSSLGVSCYYSIVQVFDLRESCPILNASPPIPVFM